MSDDKGWFMDDKSVTITDEYVFTFGKYQGETVKQTYDPCYLIWCEENITWFNLDSDLSECVEHDCEDQEADYRDTFEDFRS